MSGQDFTTPQSPSWINAGRGDDGNFSTCGIPSNSSPTSTFPKTNAVQPPDTPQPQPDKSNRVSRKRGRPKKGLNASAQRGLIRLFVDAWGTPIEQFAIALEQCGGYGRLWFRNFLQKVTGAGPGADHNFNLREIRYTGGPSPSQLDTDGSNVADGQSLADDIEQIPNVEILQRNANVGESPAPYSSADESKPSRKAPRVRHESVNALPEGLSASIVWSGATGNAEEQSPGTTVHSTQAAATFDPQQMAIPTNRPFDRPHAFVKFPESLDQPPKLKRTKKKQCPPNATEVQGATAKGKRSRDKPPRRGTSISLTGMAHLLDGGKDDGTHYQIAKKNTIRRRMSSKFSEFNIYYRTPTTGTMGSIPCPYPLPATILPFHGAGHRFPAVQILMTVWLQQRRNTDSSQQDADARRQLTEALAAASVTQKIFVNTKDDLGVSPLHLAVAYGYPQVCQLLVEYKANIHAATRKGFSIADFAEDAARRAGEEMDLYFRILHCRRFVCEGASPPAPRKLNIIENLKRKFSKKGTKQQATESIGPTPVSLESTEPKSPTTEFTPGLNYSAPGDWSVFGAADSSGPRRPSFTTELTESPTLSAVPEQRSLRSQSNANFESPESNVVPTSFPNSYHHLDNYLPILESSGPEPGDGLNVVYSRISQPVSNAMLLSTRPSPPVYHPYGYYHSAENVYRPPGAPLQPQHQDHSTLPPPFFPQTAMQQDPSHLSGYFPTTSGDTNSTYEPPMYGHSAPVVPTIHTGNTKGQDQASPSFLELTPQTTAQMTSNLALQPYTSAPPTFGYVEDTWQPSINPVLQERSGYYDLSPITTQSGPYTAVSVSAPYQYDHNPFQGQFRDIQDQSRIEQLQRPTGNHWFCMFRNDLCQREAKCPLCYQLHHADFRGL